MFSGDGREGWASQDCWDPMSAIFQNRASSFYQNSPNPHILASQLPASQPTNTKHTHSIPSYWNVPFSMTFLDLRWDSCAILHVSFCLKTSSLDPNRVSFRLFILKVMVICMCSAWVTTIWWELHFEKLFTPLLRVEASTFWIAQKCAFCRSEQDKTMWASA